MSLIEKMRLIYTKSGFYSEDKRHGFFSVLTRCEGKVKIGWLDEEEIENPSQFVQQDGLIEQGKHEVKVKGEQLYSLSEVHAIQLQAPSYQSGFVQMTLKSKRVVGPFYYQSGETQWPGEDIHTVLQSCQEKPGLSDQGRIAPNTRERAFREGLSLATRRKIWPFLLGVYPWESTAEERLRLDQVLVERYEQTKRNWYQDTAKRQSERFLEEERAIEADLQRTNRDQPALGPGSPLLKSMKDILITYQLFNPLLSYSQGMSDILAPLMVVIEDEALTFWLFVGFMDRIQHNFYIDPSGMYAQLDEFRHLLQFMDPELFQALQKLELEHLLFTFSWFLVWFKREFGWQKVMRLWEYLWSDWLTEKMLLFFALSVLKDQREKIIDEFHTPDDCLSYMSRLSGQIELDRQLKQAEQLFLQCKEKIQSANARSQNIQKQLQIRSIWNSDQRYQLQQELDLLKIPESVQALFKS